MFNRKLTMCIIVLHELLIL